MDEILHPEPFWAQFKLSGLITCMACGHTYKGYSQKYRRPNNPMPPEARHQSYVCGGWTSKGLAVCNRNGIEKGPFEDFILTSVHARLLQILEEGGRGLLRVYVAEELAVALNSPREELGRVEAELARLKADTDRLIENPTAANREFVDERLVEIKRRRRELEGRREALASVAERDLDLEAATEAALGYLARFRDVVACGPPIERKEFVGAFVERIELWPEEKRGMLQMRDMVASSLKCVGWSRTKLCR